MVALLFNLLGKIKKLLVYGTSPPSSPNEGWIWTDSNTAPPTLKVYDGSNYVGVNVDAVDGRHVGNDSGQVPVSNGTVCTDLNADLLDGLHAGNASGNIPISNGTLNTNLNADLLDGYHAGHSSGQIPISDGTVCTTLNADLVDGFHVNSTPQANQLLPLDANAKFPNSVLYTGSGNGLDADLLDGYHAGHSSGQIPISDGTLNTNLNADLVDGLHASQFVRSDVGDSLTGTYRLENATLRWEADTDYAYLHFADLGSNQKWLELAFGDDPDVDRFRISWDGTDGNWALMDFLSSHINALVELRVNGNKVWHAGNDGTGSGLDADLLDGYHAGNASGQVPVSNGTVCTNLNADMVDGLHAQGIRTASNMPLVVEVRSSDPASPVDGQIWLIV